MTTRSRLAAPANILRPTPEAWPDMGVYQLWIRVQRDLQLTVGCLGRFRLAAGLYVYTGRATRGLRARVYRHVLGGRPRHWHIDDLLASRHARLTRAVLAGRDPTDECAVNQRMAAAGTCPIPHFGASDCRHGCRAHLWRVPASQLSDELV